MPEKSLAERVIELILKSEQKVDLRELPEHIDRIGEALRRVEMMAAGKPESEPPTKSSGRSSSKLSTPEVSAQVSAPISPTQSSPTSSPSPSPVPIVKSYKGARHPGEPAVPINQSVTPEYIVCLEDGKQLKMLKRYLKTRYNMTIEEYKEKWGLPPNYPVIAPNYAIYRSSVARRSGFGAKKA